MVPVAISPRGPMQFERAGLSMPTVCLASEGSRNVVAAASCMVVGDQQGWILVPTADKTIYEVRSLRTSGCLDVEHEHGYVGARVLDYPCHGRKNQHWRVLATSASALDRVLLQSMHSGLCVEAYGFRAVMSECRPTDVGGPAFRLRKPSERWGAEDRGAHLRVLRGVRCLAQDGTRAFLADCNESTTFYFLSEGDYAPTIRLATSPSRARCLAVADRASDGYDYVVVAPCNELEASQHWFPEKVGHAWQYRNLATGACLNAQFGDAHASTRLITWPCTPSSDNAQWWYSAH